MSEDLVRQQLEGHLQTGSLAQLVKERQREHETWFLLDTSGSMAGVTNPSSTTRKIDALRRLVRDLTQTVRCPMLQFDDTCEIVVDGLITEPRGSTRLTEAIQFAQGRHATHLILISDGCPDNPASALAAARAFRHPIDVFYVGRPGDGGDRFLAELAAASGGKSQTIGLADTKLLTSAIRGLLTA